MLIRDRIKELRRVKASSLVPNVKNWRTHPESQKNALRGLLAEIGFAGAELARELDDGTLMLIDGHCRAELAGDSEIPVLVLDVDEDEADKILATFDPVAALAGRNSEKWDKLKMRVKTQSEGVRQLLGRVADKCKDAAIEARESVRAATSATSSDLSDEEQREPDIDSVNRELQSVAMPSRPYPLAIVLDKNEHSQWTRFKKARGMNSDKAAFAELLNEVDDGG